MLFSLVNLLFIAIAISIIEFNKDSQDGLCTYFIGIPNLVWLMWWDHFLWILVKRILSF